MRISYDEVSGAFTIYLRDGEPDHSEDFSEKGDVYVDVDAEGNVLSLEVLGFEDLRAALLERGGELEIPDRLEVPTDPTPPYHSTRRPDATSLREAISSLPPKQQEVLYLLYNEGLTRGEAAERLGISLAAVHRRNRNATKSLRTILRQRGRGEEDERSLEAALASLGP